MNKKYSTDTRLKTLSLGNILTLNYGKNLIASERQIGVYPVYGSNGIVGYHNDAIIKSSGIIVGRKGTVGSVHYSSTPFNPIDTTYYITPVDTPLYLPYLYYVLKHKNLSTLKADVGVPGLNRNVAYNEEVSITEDEKEQKQIVYVLSTLQKAIHKQEEIIQITIALKKSLLNKLFTQGSKGEPLNQTEIGMIPVSWEVVPLGKYAFIENGFAFKSADYVDSGIHLIRISNVSHGNLIDKDPVFLPEDYLLEYNKYALKEGDLILSLTRPVTSGGLKYCFLKKEHLPALLNQRVGRFQIRNSGKLHKQYLFHLVFSKYFVGELEKLFGSSSQQPNVSPTQLEKFLVPVPSLNEQSEMADILFSLNKKIEVVERKTRLYKDLFNSLLNELMTGSIRVNDIDLDSKISPTAMEEGRPKTIIQ